MSILIVTKPTEICRAAQRFLRTVRPDCVIVEGERTEPIPAALRGWSGDVLISFVGPWIIPAEVLEKSRLALNFHPGPAEYPGIGCYNFALYDEAAEYGVTCHEMAPLVDRGRIVKTARFPVFPQDSVASLKERSMAHLLVLFYDVMAHVLSEGRVEYSAEQWKRLPYTRRELDALCRLTRDMTPREIERRVRATTFPGAPGPYYDDATT